jgi:phosphoribosylglycinamide formyltransferase-1
MLNLAVFGSGRGSNFQAILTALHQGKIPKVAIRLVISNSSSAGILEIARTHCIPAVHLSQKQFSSDDTYGDALFSLLEEHGVNFIVLAGYMKRVPARLVGAFRGSIVNIHPALLPKFGGTGMYGMRVHEAVLEAGEQESGATVHYVDEEYDHGEIIMQQRVPVMAGDTPGTLAARVLAAEHELYPEALRRLAAQGQEKQ